jgi:hypothetical protein
MVDDPGQEKALVTLRIALSVHILRDDVGSNFCSLTIGELNLVYAFVEDWVWVGLSSESSIGLPFSSTNLRRQNGVPYRKRNLSTNVLVVGIFGIRDKGWACFLTVFIRIIYWSPKTAQRPASVLGWPPRPHSTRAYGAKSA